MSLDWFSTTLSNGKDFLIFLIKSKQKKEEMEILKKENKELKRRNRKLERIRKEYAILQDKYKNKVDSDTMKEIKNILYDKSIIKLILGHNFKEPFNAELLVQLKKYIDKDKYDLEFKFLNRGLKIPKIQLSNNINNLYHLLDENTVILKNDTNTKIIQLKLKTKESEYFKEIISEANYYAWKIGREYSELVNIAREKNLKF